MEFEIKEKYDNFIKIIDKKENELDWLKQNDKYNKYINNSNIYVENIIESNNDDCNKCICELSSGYSSFDSKQETNNNNISNNNLDLEYNELENKDVKVKYINQDNLIDSSDELSLLNENNIIIDKNINEETNSIKSEFKHLFKNNNLLKKDLSKNKINQYGLGINDSNLEDIYKKILKKKIKEKSENKDTVTYNLDVKIFENYKSIENKFKFLSNFVEKNIFEESTRGWNLDYNIYILNINKLKENLEKIRLNNNLNIIIGFFYRDYTNPKVYIEKDVTKLWIGYEKTSKTLELINKTYNINDKLLYYSLKNLIKSNKYKKKIGSINYKFIKKTIQILGNNKLIIDFVFYIGIKNII